MAKIPNQPATNAVQVAELAFHADPTDSNWKALEVARESVARSQLLARITADNEAKKAAEAREAEIARKRARLAELERYIATQGARCEELAGRISAALLTAKDLILQEEPALVEASHAAYNEALELSEQLDESLSFQAPLMPFCCSYASSMACQRAMPDDISPFHLSQYAGKFWG